MALLLKHCGISAALFRPALAIIGLLLSLGACTTYIPAEQASEFTRVDESNPYWLAVEEITPDDWQVVLNDGIEALEWRLKAIDSATTSIDLQTFLWFNDQVGSRVLQHLLQAADRGVEVKLLIDDTFLAGQDELIFYLAEHENIEYRVFNPFSRRSSNLIVRQILNLGEFHKLDHRMHNKVMIVDGKVAIVGGRNLADEYFGLDEKANFRDMELLMGGPSIQSLTTEFDQYWNNRWAVPVQDLPHLQTGEADHNSLQEMEVGEPQLSGLPKAQLRQQWAALVANAFRGQVRLIADNPPEGVPGQPGSDPVQLADELEKLINQASESIVIVSAYLIPSEPLEAMLASAVERGVEVRILTNSIQSNNHLAAHSAYRNHIRSLLQLGASLHEVNPQARDRSFYMLPPTLEKMLGLHAKVMMIDHDRVFIGSANFDPRSLRINTEMGVLVTSENLNRELRELHDPDFEPANAWKLELDASNNLRWVSDQGVLESQPAANFMQRIEDWFFAHLPIEGEM